MRIITGLFKGKNIEMPADMAVRPTIGRIKQSVFNILQFDIRDCIFVDLFSGSGSMGIEALSRGAQMVYFVDSARTSCALIRRNLTAVGAETKVAGHYRLLEVDWQTALRGLSAGSVDIVYADPPYDNADIYAGLADTVYPVLRAGGILVVESNAPLPPSHSALQQFDVRVYGTVYVTFYRKPM